MKNTETLLRSAKTPSPDVSNFQRELRGRITRPKTTSFTRPFYVVSTMAACMIFAFALLFNSFDQQITDKTELLAMPSAQYNPHKSHPDPSIIRGGVAVDTTNVKHSDVQEEVFHYIIVDSENSKYH